MYYNKLAVAIKASGKALREFEDQVFLPFGTQYSIFIKNKNSVQASVKVEIDGVDATEGVSLVVDPNDEIELERFIKNGNLERGNCFKFIKRTSSIEKHRGIKPDDGLVRIEFQFEKPQCVTTVSSPGPIWVQPWWPYPPNWPYVPPPPPVQPPYPWQPEWPRPWRRWPDITCMNNASGKLTSSNNAAFSSSSSSACSGEAYSGEVGITTPGSISDQEFNHISNFPLETNKHVIVLRLMGEHQGKVVSKTVTTRSRTSCVTCGHRSRNTAAKFCANCGTLLEIIN